MKFAKLNLQVFRGAEPSPYQGPRKAEAIVSYMVKQTLPAVTLVTAENFESFIKSDKVVIVGFFDDSDSASNQTFAAVAKIQRDEFLFGATNDASLTKTEGVKKPGIVMYKSYDEGKAVFDGPFEEVPLEAWTKESAIPLMGEIGPETYATYMESRIPLAYIFVGNEDEKKRLGELLTPVAGNFRGKVNFATIDAVLYGGHAVNLNLLISRSPCIF
jgi:protein disulfide-isomerase A1